MYTKWTFEMDNGFAINILGGLPASYQYPPTSLTRCYEECSNLLFSSQLGTIRTLSTIIGGCKICKYLHNICKGGNIYEAVERKASTLVLHGRRVLVLRSNLGKSITLLLRLDLSPKEIFPRQYR